MTALNSEPSNTLKWCVLLCNFGVFFLSIFGLLRDLVSLIISIFFLLYSSVCIVAIMKRDTNTTSDSYHTYAMWILWTLIYFAVAMLDLVFSRWSSGAINTALAMFGLFGGFMDYNYFMESPGAGCSDDLL